MYACVCVHVYMWLGGCEEVRLCGQKNAGHPNSKRSNGERCVTVGVMKHNESRVNLLCAAAPRMGKCQNNACIRLRKPTSKQATRLCVTLLEPFPDQHCTFLSSPSGCLLSVTLCGAASLLCSSCFLLGFCNLLGFCFLLGSCALLGVLRCVFSICRQRRSCR